MSEIRDLLDRETSSVQPKPGGLDRVYKRVRRRTRIRRGFTVLAALSLSGLTLGWLWIAFGGGKRIQPSTDGAPREEGATVVANIPLGNHENSAIAYGFESLWVSGFDERGTYLLRVSPQSNEVVARIPAPAADWLDGGGGLATGHGSVWAAGHTGGGEATLHRIDPVTDSVLQSLDLGPGIAVDVAVTDTDVWVLMMQWDQTPGTIVRLAPDTGHIVATIPLEGFGWVRRILPTADAVWVVGARVDESGGVHDFSLISVDPATNRVATIRSGGPLPTATDGDSLWAEAYVQEEGTRALARLDGRTGEVDVVEGSFPAAGQGIDDVTVGAGGVWFVGADGVNRYNSATGSVDISVGIDFREGVIDMAASPGSIWLLHADGTLTRIDLT